MISFVFALDQKPWYALAQWSPNPAINTPICTAPYDQYGQSIICDSAGGAIIAWMDFRSYDPDSGFSSDIYAQRIDAKGVIRWGTDGLPVCRARGWQMYPHLVPDGQGGAIITWRDARNDVGDIYIQRIDSSGIARWSPDGLPICTAVNAQLFPDIVSTGTGGAIIAWLDNRTGTNKEIYAQLIDGTGGVHWVQDGVLIATTSQESTRPVLLGYGSGGAIIAWEHYFPGSKAHLFVQQIVGTGDLIWNPTGIEICATANGYVDPKLVKSDTNSFDVVWQDSRDSSTDRVFAQRINSSGVTQWVQDGIRVSGTIGSQVNPESIGDGVGGVIVSWVDWRNGPGNIYAQRIDTSGALLWSGGGVIISDTTSYQGFQMMTGDHSGGAIVVWIDYRGGSGVGSDTISVNAQHLSASGALLWNAGGIHVSSPKTDQAVPIAVTDDSGNTIVAWNDYRSGVDFDVYAQYLSISGYLVQETSSVTVVQTGWNLISLPYSLADGRKQFLFPTAISSAFAFDGSYVVSETLKNGVGYWLKFDTSQVVTVRGYSRDIDTINVAEGWNLIGSLSDSLLIGKIISEPPDVIESSFFEFEHTYKASSVLEQAKGYWVKVREAGKLILSSRK